ncbi:hypothetical protein [Mycolicibacterium sp. D5.8-2]|uniref:hypothetical protein n=1 Tax=Mycolicibacterium sp. D5.8-2 TaxID=3085903 RepID=UPI00298D4BA7|nr:hypothetical protein [Mycolicibacterium sp. D5.8-2]MDW5612076.1 hypothetical protein [Mycolicibacterium sp. D5.8-2]
MPGRRTAAKPADTDTVTVTVTAPHLVYWDGDQRGGTITGIPTDTAQHWAKHGWATITNTPPTLKTDTQ